MSNVRRLRDDEGVAAETRLQRILAPHSYNPAKGYTRVAPLWRLDVHVPAAFNRLRWRYMAWQQRNS
jgi:hypothetical protein